MTSSSLQRRVCAVLGLGLGIGLLALPVAARDALGEYHSSPQSAPLAAHAFAAGVPYRVAEEVQPDGSRVRRFLAPNGQIFAVAWKTQYKPNLRILLGSAFPQYVQASQQAGERGGIQRQFRHQGADLVVQSEGRLHLFSGLAYQTSLLPRGVSVQSLGWS